MEKKDVAEFFDRCAPWWDSDLIRNEAVIQLILDNSGITGGMDVLDVACGTGVLFPDYLKRGVESVTGIRVAITLQAPGTLPRSEGKAKRVIDNRVRD